MIKINKEAKKIEIDEKHLQKKIDGYNGTIYSTNNAIIPNQGVTHNWYVEIQILESSSPNLHLFTVGAVQSNNIYKGFNTTETIRESGYGLGVTTYGNSGEVVNGYKNGENVASDIYSKTYNNGDIIGVRAIGETWTFYINGEDIFTASVSDLSNPRLVFSLPSTFITLRIEINLGQKDFRYPPDKIEGVYYPYDLNYVSSNKYLFKKDNNIYKITDIGIEELGKSEDTNLTKELFEEHGAENLSLLLKFEGFYLEGSEILVMSESEEIPVLEVEGKKDLFKTFPSNDYEILCMTVEEKEEPILSIEGFKDLRTLENCETGSEILISADIEREDIPIAKPYGYSTPQLILSNGDIRLDKVKKVNSMTIKADDADNKIRVIYSIDSGENWLSKKNGENVSINIKDLENIVVNGMNIDEFNSIGEDWTGEVLSEGKIRFGYYLDIDDIEDKSNIDRLEVNISMYGGWQSQRSKTNHRKSYTNENLIVKFFEDGTYKVNYGK